jgi:myo-inositol-1(or 4)-monophosphatase
MVIRQGFSGVNRDVELQPNGRRMDLKRVLDTAVAAARDAVEVHRFYEATIGDVEWGEKGQSDFVTRVDREAEARIIERIRRDYPDHRFLSEEEATGGTDVSSEAAHRAVTLEGLVAARSEPGWIWIIDPLDGTTNYLHRYPMYSASVAGMKDGELAVAAVIDGATGRSWTAVRGGGAFLDGRPIRVSGTTQPSRALIGTGFPFKTLHQLPEYVEQFGRILSTTAGVRRAGSAALDLCHLASGYFDAFWELWLAPWDVAAGALIVREAGGTVTRIDGSADIAGAGSLLASNGHLQSWMASTLGQ